MNWWLQQWPVPASYQQLKWGGKASNTGGTRAFTCEEFYPDNSWNRIRVQTTEHGSVAYLHFKASSQRLLSTHIAIFKCVGTTLTYFPSSLPSLPPSLPSLPSFHLFLSCLLSISSFLPSISSFCLFLPSSPPFFIGGGEVVHYWSCSTIFSRVQRALQNLSILGFVPVLYHLRCWDYHTVLVPGENGLFSIWPLCQSKAVQLHHKGSESG